MGGLLAVLVLAADISDRDGGAALLQIYSRLYPLLQKIWADHGYQGDLQAHVLAQYQIILEIVSKPPGQKGFVVLPKRWIVERTLAWFMQGRRLVRDYEREPAYSEAWVWISAIHRTVKHLTADTAVHGPAERQEVA